MHQENRIKCPSCGHTSGFDFLTAPDRFHGRSKPYYLAKCSDCSLVWLRNSPPPEEMGEHYGPDYDRSVAAAGELSPDRWTARRDTLEKYRTSGRVLDLGCSQGGFLGSLPREKWELFGIEMSRDVAESARKRTGANIFVGDILDAPFPAGSFDAVTCFHVFEHLYKPKEVLDRVSRWLKPGGVFFCLVPNIDSAGARVFKTYWYALELPRHLFHYSPASLSYMARSSGLQVESIQTVREVFVEKSSSYILNDLLGHLNIERPSMAVASAPSLPFRVVRKAFRMTILPGINALIGLAGDKESIHAVFRK